MMVEMIGQKKAEKKVPFNRLTKPIDVARAAAYFCSDESGLTTGSIIDYDQTVLGWHSYSAYDTNILDNSLLGEQFIFSLFQAFSSFHRPKFLLDYLQQGI